MKAQVVSFTLNSVVSDVRNVELPDNYDGNPYGDTVPFAIGSNQIIVTDPDWFYDTEE